MSGPPGAGKTLLARSLPSILPRLTLSEALDVTRIYSVADMLPSDTPLIRQRPFIHVEVPRVPFQKLSDERRGETSAAIRARVEAARARQTAQFAVGAGLPARSTTSRGARNPPSLD